MKRHLIAAFILLAFHHAAFARSASSDEIEVTVLDAPDFKATKVGKLPSKPRVSLRVSSSKANQITDTDEWFARNNLVLNNWRGELPASIPRELNGVPLQKSIYSGGHILALYGADATKTLFVLGASKEGEVQYAFDFSNYQYAPRNVHAEYDYIHQQIVWAEQVGNVLYVSHGHSTYAWSSYGMNAYVSAIDVENGEALWHSAPLVSNASNFTILGDSYLVTGYGFTAESDFLYVLRAEDGRAVARIPVKSGPTYILPFLGNVWVRTYNTDYVFDVVGRP